MCIVRVNGDRILFLTGLRKAEFPLLNPPTTILLQIKTGCDDSS